MGQCEKIFYPFFNQNTLYKTLIHLSYVQYEYCRLLAFHNRLGVLAAGNVLFLHFNPPKPETFFASDFDDFCKCCSYVTLEKGLGEKYFFFTGSVFFWCGQKRLFRLYRVRVINFFICLNICLIFLYDTHICAQKHILQ